MKSYKREIYWIHTVDSNNKLKRIFARGHRRQFGSLTWDDVSTWEIKYEM